MSPAQCLFSRQITPQIPLFPPSVLTSAFACLCRQVQGPGRQCLRHPPPGCTVHVLLERPVVLKDLAVRPHTTPISISSPVLEKELIPAAPSPRAAVPRSPRPAGDGDLIPTYPSLRGTDPSLGHPASSSSFASFSSLRPTEEQATLRDDSAPRAVLHSQPAEMEDLYPDSNGGESSKDRGGAGCRWLGLQGIGRCRGRGAGEIE